jgi:glycosyltransferase involved in cell wall biosynthesis
MKVLIISASLNERSGWGRYARSVISELSRQGIDTTVLSEESQEIEGVRVHNLVKLRSRLSLYTLLRNAIRTRSLARGVDIVHALDGWPYGVYGYAGVIGTSKKLFMNGVGTYSVAPLYEGGSAFLLRLAYARAKEVFCISDYTRNRIVAAGINKSKIRTVHLGAPYLPQITLDEAQKIAQKLGVSKDANPIVLTVGSIKDRKGQLDTLRAIEMIKPKYPKILYIVAGSGNQKDYIAALHTYAVEHQLESNLLIITEADDRGIAALYAVSSLFALNSNSDPGSNHFEGFGLVVLEAAGFGKPAIGSSNSGVEDAIDEGKTGYLTRQHDPSDIAQKLESVLEKYEFLASNAKMWHSQFTWQKTVAEYIRAYAK